MLERYTHMRTKSNLILEGLSRVSEGRKNLSGGEVLKELSYGSLKVIYETYWHSFLQKKLSIISGNEIIGRVLHIDNEDAFKKCWKEIEDCLNKFKKDTPKGEASYHDYLNNYNKVEKELVSILKKYKNKMVTKKYDPVSGKVLESTTNEVPKDLIKAFDDFWKDYGANDYREFMWKIDKFADRNSKLVDKYTNYKEYAVSYLKSKSL